MPLLDTPVRLGVQIQPQHATYTDIRDAALRFEDMGVDILFNWDHFFPLYGDPDGAHFESWTMLAAWAEQTERVEFGALVNCNSYRNPDLQADMARTIDHISAKGGEGRFIFGTGSGWFERDYDEYGYEFGTAGSRLNDLGDGLGRVTARWSTLNPAPTRHIPILIGGKGEQKTLRLVARHADIWHSFVDPQEIAHKVGVIERWAETEERDVSGLIVSNELKDRDAASADALFDAGTRLFTLGVNGPDYDVEIVRTWLAWRDAKNGGRA
ncbi:LLM class F420-dependent oxidoreductase [Microbacterium sp. cx-55]|uniref:LLM class F420-dependent oxidoreductase n=1 Tax=unclassified Microbacterium TaxID=2609290 RepID=UPI001CBD3DE3|nr:MULTISPECIES: LLM class F420-dependent oxidoreductase [unclassified Microbacterium]MBZ4487858.1 LLM class F420-dependent oxidoreductase [Microbacterium sp. cx-55]MCC4909115.1 LLM class F420-dependent oxidoreductase [Microbacterium sp. cx-59]UGB34730.1 LLM class F420-dependent oxidoreductase [Microbacterium sp. cx-55]